MAGKGDTFTQNDPHRAKKQKSAPYLFLDIECERPLVGPARHLLADIGCVRLGRGPRRMARGSGRGALELMLPDGWMSEAHAELRRESGGELEQALASALALSNGGTIEREHLPPALRKSPTDVPQRELTDDERRHRDELIGLLKQGRGNLTAVARAVGKGRTQVVRWVGRYGLDAEAYRSG